MKTKTRIMCGIIGWTIAVMLTIIELTSDRLELKSGITGIFFLAATITGLVLIAIQTINSAFIDFLPDGLVLALTIAILTPLVIKFISKLNQQEKIQV